MVASRYIVATAIGCSKAEANVVETGSTAQSVAFVHLDGDDDMMLDDVLVGRVGGRGAHGMLAREQPMPGQQLSPWTQPPGAHEPWTVPKSRRARDGRRPRLSGNFGSYANFERFPF